MSCSPPGTDPCNLLCRLERYIFFTCGALIFIDYLFSFVGMCPRYVTPRMSLQTSAHLMTVVIRCEDRPKQGVLPLQAASLWNQHLLDVQKLYCIFL